MVDNERGFFDNRVLDRGRFARLGQVVENDFLILAELVRNNLRERKFHWVEQQNNSEKALGDSNTCLFLLWLKSRSNLSQCVAIYDYFAKEVDIVIG